MNEIPKDSNYDPKKHIPLGKLMKHLLSEVLKGNDLHRITLPSYILSPRTLLQKYTDLTYYFHYLFPKEGDCQEKDIIANLKSVLIAYMAGWSVNLEIFRKPINSLLGEFLVGKQTANSVDSEFLFEQVSHHPPIFTFYFANENQKISGQAEMKSKFGTQSTAMKMIGFIKYENLRTKTWYTFTFPNFVARNLIFGKQFCELQEKVIIKGAGSAFALDGEILFKSRGQFGGEKHLVNGILRLKLFEQENTKIFVLTGNFTEKLYFFPFDNIRHRKSIFYRDIKNGEIVLTNHIEKEIASFIYRSQIENYLLYDLDKLVKSKISFEINGEESDWESHKVWKNLAELILNESYDKADLEKNKLENFQRMREKKYKDLEKIYEPKFFSLNNNEEWILKQNIKQKENGLIKSVRDYHKKNYATSPTSDEIQLF